MSDELTPEEFLADLAVVSQASATDDSTRRRCAAVERLMAHDAAQRARIERLAEQLEAQSVTYQENLTEIQLLKAGHCSKCGMGSLRESCAYPDACEHPGRELAAKLNQAVLDLAAVTEERDEWKRKYDLIHDSAEYQQCCDERRKAEAERDASLAKVAELKQRVNQLEGALEDARANLLLVNTTTALLCVQRIEMAMAAEAGCGGVREEET